VNKCLIEFGCGTGKFTLPMVDVVYGVNANYRMFDIKEAINKMRSLASERVVIVWTMQRSPDDAILNESKVKGIGRGQEYIQLLNALYEMGIDPNMKIMTVTKSIQVEDISIHHEALEKIGKEYGLEKEPLIDNFNNKVIEIDNNLVYLCPLKVAIIDFIS